MIQPKKTFRYYYWLTSEFIKKNLKLILLTFFLSFVLIIALVSLYPFLENIFLSKKQVIGLVGKYRLNNLPNEILYKISSGLVFVKTDGTIIPALASTWEINDNGKKFLIHLKQNLIWNDGKKFTSRDIGYKFNNDVTTVVLDDNTIIYELKTTLPIFINYLNKPVIRKPLTGVGGLYRTGRIFMKNTYVKELYLIPNKKNISVLVYKFYDNEDQLIAGYKKGEISEFSSSKKTLVEAFYNWKNTQVSTSVDYSRLLTLFFNFNNPLLKERDIRSAIKMGIDIQAYKDYGQQANGPIAPTSWAFNQKIKPSVFDQNTAKKIIENTVSASQSSQLNFVSYYEYSDLIDIVSNNLKNIGLKVNLNYLSQNLGNNFDLLLAYWKIPEDPDQYYFWHSEQKDTNIGNYKNLKLDKLLEDGRKTYRIGERTKIYQEYQKVITDDPPALFLFYPYLYTVKRK